MLLLNKSFNIYLLKWAYSINLIKNNTCFKWEPSCIDFVLTNRKYSFTNCTSFETVLSDHHHWIHAMLKTTCYKEEQKAQIYRDCKTFSLEHRVLNYFQNLNHKTTMNTKHLKKTLLTPWITKLWKSQNLSK